MYQKPHQVSIIGFGRFGQLWANLLKADFQVLVYDSSKAALKKTNVLGVQAASLDDALSAPVIFYSVPISEFAQTIASHAAIFKTMTGVKLLIDLLSVKMHAKEVFTREIPEPLQVMLTHPMFGPDSLREAGVAGQRIVVEKYRAENETYEFWKKYFIEKELDVLELTAEEHDKQAASSQALTHLVGRILTTMQFSPSSIDTNNSKKLQEIAQQVSKDELQLFLDLQRYNPYTQAMRADFVKAQTELYKLIEGS
ncbi:MAG: prephenate dehydrogenase/arogenate dehydrogenase family protein [Candidatus Obscuribacterales bacterium]|jgi:prephenate dehydrogenase